MENFFRAPENETGGNEACFEKYRNSWKIGLLWYERSPKISRIPRIFAFYDTNVGKNIINALNVRVLWYERGEKYHKCLECSRFMIWTRGKTSQIHKKPNLGYISPSKTPQIKKTSNLGYIFPFKNTPNQENEQFGIHLPQKKPKM